MGPLGKILMEQFGLDAIEVIPQQGGWSALAYRVTTVEGSYFLKVYEKSRASTPKWTALIDKYVPIILWLSQHTSLHGRIPVPLLTTSEAYKYEDEAGIYQLFAYIEGSTIGDQALSTNQIQQLAEIVSNLHQYGAEIPLDTEAIKEDFSLSFTKQLKDTMLGESHLCTDDVKQLIKPYEKMLRDCMEQLEKMSVYLQKSELEMRLCHTDLHHWNLMQADGRLILIDWEGLKLAPVEADLMFMIDKPYFAEWMKIYRQTHTKYEINQQALAFYQIRRIVEDISELLEQLLLDGQGEQDRIETFRHVKEELDKLDRFSSQF